MQINNISETNYNPIMPTQEIVQEQFVQIRCFNCGKILFEATAETTGTVRKRCDNNKCKAWKTIRLPLMVKKDNLLPVRA